MTNLSDRSAINDPSYGTPPAWYFFNLPWRNLSFMRVCDLVPAVVIAPSSWSLPLIKSDYLVVESHFASIPFLFCAFLFLSTRVRLTSFLFLSRSSFPVSISRHLVPCLRNDRHSEPRPFSARWLDESRSVRCTDHAVDALCPFTWELRDELPLITWISCKLLSRKQISVNGQLSRATRIRPCLVLARRDFHFTSNDHITNLRFARHWSSFLIRC